MAIAQGVDVGQNKVRKITIQSNWNVHNPVEGAKPQRKILVVPSNLVTFRQFSFPFQDKRRIQEILPGELRDSLAFPLDNVRWDVSSIEKERVNTFIVPKDALAEFTQAHGNASNVIDVEPCALARVALFNKMENVLVIDFGARKTTFLGIKNGKFDLVRIRMIGGGHLDMQISKEKGISQEIAESQKISAGLKNSTVKNFFETLIQSASLPSPIEYENVIITGGGSLTPGLPEYLAEILGVPVKYFELPGDLSPHFDAVAFGAALYDSVGKEKVNLVEQQKTVRNDLITWLAVLILIPLILLSINLKMKEGFLKRENIKISDAMNQAIRANVPGIGRIVSPVNQLRPLVEGTESGSSMKVIDFLDKLSQAKQGVTATFYEIDVNDGQVKLKGESDSFQSVDSLKASLDKQFSKVEIVDQATKPNGKVDFYIKITLETVEDGQQNS